MRRPLAHILLCCAFLAPSLDTAYADEPEATSSPAPDGQTAAASAPVVPEQETTILYEIGGMAIHGNDVDALVMGLGIFDVADNETSAAATLEYRFGCKLSSIGPAIGAMANSDGGMFGYFGIYSDLSFGDVFLTPLLGMGAYREGDSRDLGGVFQFRQSVDVAYRFENSHRLGARVTHVSNAGIYDSNPGEEEVYLTYSLPFGPLL